jgi:type VI secretion system protein VasG
LSSHVENAVERGWVYATLMFGEGQVRTGHLAVGMLKTPSLRNALMAISRQFEKIKSDTLTEEFAKIVNGSPEDRLGATDASSMAGAGEASDAMAPAQMGKQEALKRFATNLTEKARKGEIDPVSGRDEEIRPDRRHPDAPPAEQPDPDRRGRGSGRPRWSKASPLRLARGDVPPPLAERVVVHARHRPAAGRLRA